MSSIDSLAGPSGIPSVATSAASAKAARAAAKAGSGEAGVLGANPSAQDQSNRFLKLLVAQMSNQDPLNPMDSAQVTSQMAQISTVEGVQTLNKTVSGLDTQFTQLQTMQGAALVGHDVATSGNQVRVDPATKKGDGGFELAGPATSVSVDVLDAAGRSIDTIKLGAQPAGRHSFSLDVPQAAQGQALTFKVTAANNANAVDAAPLAYDSISAVSTQNGKLTLELDNGQRIGYDEVWGFL